MQIATYALPTEAKPLINKTEQTYKINVCCDNIRRQKVRNV